MSKEFAYDLNRNYMLIEMDRFHNVVLGYLVILIIIAVSTVFYFNLLPFLIVLTGMFIAIYINYKYYCLVYTIKYKIKRRSKQNA